MTYEEQLSAAKHRAERDQARQEAKGLREELETAEAEYRRHRANLDARYEKKADESRRRGQAMHGMSRLIRERNEEIKALKERIADMEPRLMPDGCEWPRYDTGEPVPLGGEVKVTVHDEDGDFDRTFAIRSIKYEEDGVLLEGTKNEMVVISHGERVRRPAVSAADGDGCCEPGTYRCQEAAFTCDSCGHTVFVDKCMVDEIRYLRAKGIRTLNCCCGHGEKVEPFIIVNEGDECRMLNMGYERRVNKHGVTYFTPKSACPPKALAADGEPLRVGQTVWEVVTGDGYVVERIYSGTTEPDFPGHTVACRRPDDIVTHMFKPSQLTHQRPVLDADGVSIKAGDTIYSDGHKEGLIVDGYQHDGSLIAHMRDGNHVVIRNPQHFTHAKPVPGADGKNLLRGETVYNVVDGEECRVLGFSDCTLDVNVMGEDGSLKAVCHDVLTHTKPEIDTWERLEKDANDLIYDIGFHLGDYSPSDFNETGDSIQDRVRDIVRRAKALAGDA